MQDQRKSIGIQWNAMECNGVERCIGVKIWTAIRKAAWRSVLIDMSAIAAHDEKSGGTDCNPARSVPQYCFMTSGSKMPLCTTTKCPPWLTQLTKHVPFHPSACEEREGRRARARANGLQASRRATMWPHRLVTMQALRPSGRAARCSRAAR